MGKRYAALISTLGALLLASSAAAATTAHCDLVASPTGSDSAPGTLAAPLRTVQRLVDLLGPGQTGCLLSGTYSGDVEVGHGGTAAAPLTVTSYPGASATVLGRLWIAQGSNYVTFTGLALDGRNAGVLPSPTVNANYATFSDDDVTNDHTGICFVLGSNWGSATGTVITHDRIHDCGVLPAQNHDHGIYVEDAQDTLIEWNLIYDNADRGIQLYPDAQNTTIDHNVIDGNGEGIIFSGDNGLAANNTNVYANIISNSHVRHDVESWYPAGNPLGQNNIVQGNCVFGGREGTIDTSGGGFSAFGNTVAAPMFVNAAAGDFLLEPGSPCLAVTGNIAAVLDGQSASTLSARIPTHRNAQSRRRPLTHGRLRRRHRRG